MNKLNIVQLKDISIIFAGLIAFIGLISGSVEYYRRNRHERIHSFLELRQRFLDNQNFKQILNHVNSNDPDVANINIQDRRHLVGFLEEVGLLVQSNVIPISIAHYMFGYYVESIAKCELFWKDLDSKSEYWTVFRKFDADLAVHRQKLSAKSLSKF